LTKQAGGFDPRTPPSVADQGHGRIFLRVATRIEPAGPRLPLGLRVGAVVRRETLVKALGIGAVDGLVLAGVLQPRYP